MEESHKISFFVSHLPSDHERVALGNEEGLFVIHVTKDGKNHLKSRFFFCFFFNVTTGVQHASFHAHFLRNNPRRRQQEGAPDRPDPAGTATGRHLWPKPPRPSHSDTGPGWQRAGLVQAGRHERLPDDCVRLRPQRLFHLPVCGHEETDHML